MYFAVRPPSARTGQSCLQGRGSAPRVGRLSPLANVSTKPSCYAVEQRHWVQNIAEHRGGNIEWLLPSHFAQASGKDTARPALLELLVHILEKE